MLHLISHKFQNFFDLPDLGLYGAIKERILKASLKEG